MNQYSIVIIGCGSIGALKPDHIDFPGSENILKGVLNTINKECLETDNKWIQLAEFIAGRNIILFGLKRKFDVISMTTTIFNSIVTLFNQNALDIATFHFEKL